MLFDRKNMMIPTPKIIIKIMISTVATIFAATSGGLAFVQALGWAQGDFTTLIVLFAICAIIVFVVSLIIPPLR